MFKAFIKGECIRHARNKNDPRDLEEILGNFKTHLSKRCYSSTEIDPNNQHKEGDALALIKQTKTQTTNFHDYQI